jgi:hypothetical protein
MNTRRYNSIPFTITAEPSRKIENSAVLQTMEKPYFGSACK